MAIRRNKWKTKRSRPRRRKYPCDKCKGTGKIDIPLNECGPGGETEQTCPVCKGAGKILTKPKDHIDVLYDRLSKKSKDMTRSQFRRSYLRMMDPLRTARLLQRFRLQRATMNELSEQRKRAIDEVLEDRK